MSAAVAKSSAQTGVAIWRNPFYLGWAAATLLVLAVPLTSPDNYLLHMAILIMNATVQAMSWNLLGGFAGQKSFGHAAFFGTGAYTFALLYMKLQWDPLACLLAGALAGVVLAVPVGLVLFRLRGAYFALSMLAIAEVTRLVVQNWRDLTNGPAGLLFTSPFPDKRVTYAIVALILSLCFLTTTLLVRSKFGYYFVAIREDQDVARTLGVNLLRYKLVAMVFSAFFMGLAGSFYGLYYGNFEPNIVYSGLEISLTVLIITVVGGIGTIGGPLIGAIILTISTEVIRSGQLGQAAGQANALLSGLLLIVVILFLPEGIWGRVSQAIERRRLARGATSAIVED
ncbi:MAG: branched-chain amino acid ABC transporter permease [Chloroflexi bacterium]|nr:branched-chain amino acid ABC transporter permease [Chloroflexota bacterium]